MLTDAEKDALARRILTRVLRDFGARLPPNLFKAIKSENGEHVAIFADTSLKGDGSFACQYMPIDPTKKIVKHCEHIYDDFIAQNEVHPTFEEFRNLAVELMAECAVLHVIASFSQRLRDLLEDVVEDSYAIASGFLAACLASYLIETDQGRFSVDMKAQVESAIKRAADKKRTLIREHITVIPHVRPERGRGGSQPKHQWTDTDYECLAQKYDELKVVWIDAKRIAKDAQKAKSPKRNQGWQAEVLRAYPDLPNDLLARFAHLRSDDAKPSDLAIIHALRECGVKEPYTPRELREKIRAWKLKNEQSNSAKTPENAEPQN
jgi:hypothetical protein